MVNSTSRSPTQYVASSLVFHRLVISTYYYFHVEMQLRNSLQARRSARVVRQNQTLYFKTIHTYKQITYNM